MSKFYLGIGITPSFRIRYNLSGNFKLNVHGAREESESNYISVVIKNKCRCTLDILDMCFQVFIVI